MGAPERPICTKSRHLSAGVVFGVTRRCTPLATLSLERYAVPWRVRNRGAQPMAHHAVPWRVRNHGAVVACEITTHSSWCRPMKKGASQYDPHPY